MNIITNDKSLIRFGAHQKSRAALLRSMMASSHPNLLHIDAPNAPIVFDGNSFDLCRTRQLHINADRVVLNDFAFDMGDLETVDIWAHYVVFMGNWALNCPELRHLRIRAPHVIMRPFALYGARPKITVNGKNIATAPYGPATIIADVNPAMTFDAMDKNLASIGEIPVQQALYAHGNGTSRYTQNIPMARRALDELLKYITR